MLRTRVKASEVRNLTDARYFSAWEVEWIGFNLEEGTSTYIEPGMVKEMKNWLEGPKFVGEFNTTSASEIQGWVEMLQLDAIQLGHAATLETVQNLSKYAIIKEFVIDSNTKTNKLMTEISVFSNYIEAFILNFSSREETWSNIKNGNYLPLSDLKQLCATYPILLQLDLQPKEAEDLLNILQPLGLCFTGGEEEKVGYKSFDEIDEIIEELYYE